MINRVILVGRLGADPDLRFAPNGTAVARFNVATTERVPVGDGNWEERTEWHRVVVFGKLAETCGNYLSKGRLVYIEGRLRTRQWEDRDGNARYTTEVVCEQVKFLGGSRRNGSAEEAAAEPFGSSSSGVPDDDDVPF